MTNALFKSASARPGLMAVHCVCLLRLERLDELEQHCVRRCRHIVRPTQCHDPARDCFNLGPMQLGQHAKQAQSNTCVRLVASDTEGGRRNFSAFLQSKNLERDQDWCVPRAVSQVRDHGAEVGSCIRGNRKYLTHKLLER